MAITNNNTADPRMQTYIGNTLTVDDINMNGARKVTQMAVGKERIDSSYLVKPVKTSPKVRNLSKVKLPKGSVAVGEINLGSKVIIEEPREIVKYIDKEIPVEEIVYKPVITTEYVEKDVPVYFDEEVEEDIEVEEIVYEDYFTEQTIDKFVTVERKIPQTVERKIPVTLTIPKIVQKEVEKIIEVPSGEIIHRDVKVVTEKVNHKRRFVEKHVPIIVSHDIHPIVRHDPNIVREVEVVDHYPVMTPVDVHICKPVNINVRAAGVGHVTHKVVTVPAAHYNTLLKKLNPNLHEDLPLFMEDGVIPMLNQELSFLYPPTDAEIEGFNAFEAAFNGIQESHYLTSSSSSSSSKKHGSHRHHNQHATAVTSSRSRSGLYTSVSSTSNSSNAHGHHAQGHSVIVEPTHKKKVCGVC